MAEQDTIGIATYTVRIGYEWQLCFWRLWPSDWTTVGVIGEDTASDLSSTELICLYAMWRPNAGWDPSVQTERASPHFD